MEFTTNWFPEGKQENFKSTLAEMDGELEFLEIGCWEGRTTVWLLDNFPDAHVTAVDTFEGFSWEGYHGGKHKVDDDGVKERFFRNIEEYEDRVDVLEGKSQEVLRELPEGCFDFIYVDGSHAEGDVIADAELSAQLVKEEGIIIFDDYGNSWRNVKKEVVQFLEDNDDFDVIDHNENVAQLAIRKKVTQSEPVEEESTPPPQADGVSATKGV